MISDGQMTVGALAGALEDRFPSAMAEPWDRVGLIVGDPATEVAGVLVTLDATTEAVNRAVASGANVLVTHHPPFLEAPVRFVPAPGSAGTVAAALRQGCAVISLHTNLDRADEGASALALALGLNVLEPLESGTEPVTLLTAMVPPEFEGAVRAAMEAAGAGRMGEYAGCAFVSDGVGHFTARAGAAPDRPAGSAGTPESRIEMVCAPSTVERVLEAARAAHPYEEPSILGIDGRRVRASARLGRICTWSPDSTLGDLARHVSETLGVAARVWGDPERPVLRVAVANGSAGSLLARAASVSDVIVAGEVRYHDALDAVASGLAIIEAGHDATEWPLVAVLGRAVVECAPDVNVRCERPAIDWWTVEASDDRR